MKRLLVCLTLLASSASAQVVESGRTLADLIASHPCSSGLTNRIARVTDCDAADDIGDGAGAFQCWAICDGTAPWETVAIGGGGSSGTGDVVGPASSVDNGIARFDSTTGKLLQDGSLVTLSDVGNLQWEGTTADDFEFNVTVADPTSDSTLAFDAAGAMSAPGSITAGHLLATAANTYDIGSLGGGSGFRFRNLYLSGDLAEVASIGNSNGNFWVRTANDVRLGPIPITWGGTNAGSTDTTIQRGAAGVLKITSAIHLDPLAAPPRTCDATGFGDIYVDTSLALCFCDGTAYQVLNPLTAGVGTCS